MKNNETGEFELVVGDRHLLVAFFIVVLLCGVAFAMGYVVGQNVPHSGKATAESIPPTSSSGAADTRPQPLPPAPAPATSSPTPAEGEKPADSSPQPTTQPAQEAQSPTPSTPAPETPAAPSGNGLVPSEALPEGSFWQVLAVALPQAEAVRKTLKDHNFPVILSPGPKGLTRVLVGPYPDTQAMGKAKTELENAGFRTVRYKP